MRQVGYLAAAGIYALDNNIERLAEDHRRAKEIAEVLKNVSWVASVEPVETNILIFTLVPNCIEKNLIELLKQKNILISSMGHGKLRIVTHLDYKEVMHTYVLEALQKLV
jgi:threonine aldolase